ncbi:MAG: cation:proton antiporter, partial [Halioglobus sp.]|nr:cation:proton antiporter [Halioglobus sp.]
HGELFTLAGLVLALGGAALFELVGIKGDLGVLILGAWLAGHQKTKELSRNLLQFKDLFLVGFFLTIGLQGWPEQEYILLSLLLGALALLKPLLYFPLLTLFHTPPRTALLSAISLSNFSEFGLIVIAVAAANGTVDAHWTATLSLVIAVSFILNSPLSRQSHTLYRRWRSRLLRFESARVRRALPDTSGARVIILGMGNIGTGAYESIAEHYGPEVVGVDENPRKLAMHRDSNRRVVEADASNPDFWLRVKLDDVELVMLALTNHEENLLVCKLLKELGYRGRVSAVVRFDEEARELRELGVSVFNLYAQAGAGFAAHSAEQLAAAADAPRP